MGQIAAAVTESKNKNYADYKAAVVQAADVPKEVAEIVAKFNVALAKDARLTDLAKLINAEQAQPEGVLIKQAFELAAKRKAKLRRSKANHGKRPNMGRG